METPLNNFDIDLQHWPLTLIFKTLKWENVHSSRHSYCLTQVESCSALLLRSAVGKTHDLRSDLWWIIPLRILLDHFGIPFGSQPIKSALARHSGVQVLSVSAIIYPRWTATIIFEWDWKTNAANSSWNSDSILLIRWESVVVIEKDHGRCWLKVPNILTGMPSYKDLCFKWYRIYTLLLWKFSVVNCRCQLLSG